MANHISEFYWMILLLPMTGLGIARLIYFKNSSSQAKCITQAMWLAFVVAILLSRLGFCHESQNTIAGIKPDQLSWLMATFILFISAIVLQFSRRYMKGDSHYQAYFKNICLLTVTMLLLVAQDNIILFCLSFGLCNFLLVRLMKHKGNWEQAVMSAKLTQKNLAYATAFLSIAALYTSIALDTLSIHEMKCRYLANFSLSAFPPVCLILCCLMQSACWPFQRWLLSSLNSPTGVSAFMHAGLVNGAGILLARFAWLFTNHAILLDVLVVWGLVAALLGMIWKMIQTDVKRTLACSTVGQMGFMIMQAGLGLFSSMLAHIICHGLFKACLFLQSGSALQQKKVEQERNMQTGASFIAASLCSFFALWGVLTAGYTLFSFFDSSMILLLFVYLAAYQTASSIINNRLSVQACSIACALCFAAGALYGWTTCCIKQLVTPLSLWQPRELHQGHVLLILLMLLIWQLDKVQLWSRIKKTKSYKQMYVKALNASQPDPETVTASRLSYNY